MTTYADHRHFPYIDGVTDESYPVGYPAQQRILPSGYMQPSPYDNNLVAVAQPMINQGFQPNGFPKHAFSDVSVQHLFVRKIFAVLFVRFLVIFGVIGLTLYNHSVSKVLANSVFWWCSLSLMVAVCIVLALCVKWRRKFPNNVICLIIYTLVGAFMLASASATYVTEVIIETVGITAAVCLAFILFTLQRRLGFSFSIGAVYSVIIVMIVFSVVALLITYTIVDVIIASIISLLYSLYLVFAVTTLMSVDYIHALAPDEYIFGALNIYLDFSANLLDIIRCSRCRKT